MKSVINEIARGFQAQSNYQRRPAGNFTGNFRQNSQDNSGFAQQSSMARGVFRPRFFHQMSGWQNSVVQLLTQNEDVYVTASPSAGKTMPMFCYWFEQILGINTRLEDPNRAGVMIRTFDRVYHIINNPREVQKLLILVPVVSLAQRTYEEFIDDMVDLIGNLIYQCIHFLLQYNIQDLNRDAIIANAQRRMFQLLMEIDRMGVSGTSGVVSNSRYNMANLLNRRNRYFTRYEDYVRRAQQMRTNSRLGAGVDSVNPERSRINQEIEILLNNIRNLDSQIDEAAAIKIREYVKANFIAISTGPAKSERSELSSCFVLIATYQSAQNVLERHINPRNVGMLVCDEAHLMQQYADEIKNPKDTEHQTEQIARNVYYALTNINRNARVLLMSGTIHPESAQELSEYFRLCLNRNLRVFGNIPEGNPAQIGIIPTDWLSDQKKVIENLLVNPVTKNNLLLVFSKFRIMDMIKTAVKRRGSSVTSLAAIDQNVRIDKTLDDPFSSNTNVQHRPNEDRIRKTSQTINATEIFFPLQKLAVSVGIGFIFRMDDKIPGYDEAHNELYQNDFRIVTELFRQGVIKTILATDAVGIGVNMTVANMYIPSLEKPTFHGGLEEIRTAELSQLLHRTGRRAFVAASIYTPTKWVGKVNEALSISRTGRDIEKRTTIKLNRGLCEVFSIFRQIITRK